MDEPRCPSCRRDLGRKASVNYAVLAIMERIKVIQPEIVEERETFAFPVRRLRSGRHAPDDDSERRDNSNREEEDIHDHVRDNIIDAGQVRGIERMNRAESSRRSSPVRIRRERSRSTERDRIRGERTRADRRHREENSDRLFEEVQRIQGKKTMALTRRPDGSISAVRMTFYEK